MLKKIIEEMTYKAIEKALNNGDLQGFDVHDVNLTTETPKNLNFGDFAINVSSLARFAKIAPPIIAEIIAKNVDMDDVEVTPVAGFINFKLGNTYMYKIILEILKTSSNYGKLSPNSEKVLLEYVSANPTGPFHIGHGRWAAMGSALANLLQFSGYDVSQEFYINDAGSQIDNMARSVYLRLQQQRGMKVDFPSDEEAIKKYYPGEYLVPAASAFAAKFVSFCSDVEYDELSKPEKDQIKTFAKAYMMDLQKALLARLNVVFDNYFSETTLYEDGKITEVIDKLKKSGYTYENEGALWFKTTDFGDEKDRVLIKSDGSYTYLLPDIAYHVDKLERGFNRLINIWGADHHGYVLRMKAALQALGYSQEALEVLLGQLVNLKMGEETLRMGKRKKMVTLEELVDEVGTDATRYWMTFRNIDTTLDFDVELAKSKCDENPVFYVQYAHARACSIIRTATQENPDRITKEIKPAMITPDELSKYISEIKETCLAKLFSDNTDENEATKRLLLKIEEFKSVIENSARLRAPYIICKYLQDLAAQFHSFYAVVRVISDDIEVTKARLSVIQSLITVLANGLSILGISAPEKM